MSAFYDLSGKLVENYIGEPSKFKLGDRVEVKESSGQFPGWTGEVVGFQVHNVGSREQYFLLPIVKLDQGSQGTVSYYPFSLCLHDPIEALARLGRP